MATDELIYSTALSQTVIDKSIALQPVDEYQRYEDYHKSLHISLDKGWFLFQNLLSTPSFEKDSDSNGLADDWTANTTFAKALDTDTRYIRHGKYSQRIAPGGSTNGIYQEITVTAGKYYSVILYYVRGGPGPMFMRLSAYNNTTLIEDLKDLSLGNNNILTRVMLSQLMPATTNKLRIAFLQSDSTNTTYWIDMVCIALGRLRDNRLPIPPSAFNITETAKKESRRIITGEDITVKASSSGNKPERIGTITFNHISYNLRNHLQRFVNTESTLITDNDEAYQIEITNGNLQYFKNAYGINRVGYILNFKEVEY